MSAAAARKRLGVVGGSLDATFADGLDQPPWCERVSLRVYRDELPLAADVDAGRLDLAALSTSRLLERVGALELVPGLAVTTDGPSGLARLVADVALDRVRAVTAADTSGAAALLARILFAESGRSIDVLPPGEADVANDAARIVLASDSGQAPGHGHTVDIDLGAAWTELTSLPFVWSAWTARRGLLDRSTYALLHSARTRGRRRVARGRSDRAAHLVTRLGRRELEALDLLRRTCVEHGLLACADEIAIARLSAVDACREAADRLRAGESS